MIEENLLNLQAAYSHNIYNRPCRHIMETQYSSIPYVGMAQQKMAAPLNMYKNLMFRTLL